MRNLIEVLSEIPDPRIDRTKLHPLENVLMIAFLAVMSGADTFEEIEFYGRIKREWLSQYLDMEHGIPSHDTFNRVFQMLNPQVFQQHMVSWLKELVGVDGPQIIAIDGKTARSSCSLARRALHSISAWVSANHLTLGQLRCEDKSNEITAIPILLEIIDPKGSIITIDAMGTQQSIAKDIVERQGDYVLALKENQGRLYQDVIEYFDDQQQRRYCYCSKERTIDAAHGRIEERVIYCADADEAGLLQTDKWEKLRSIIKVQTTVQRDQKASMDTRYYISSLEHTQAALLLHCIRSHWGIENSLHWVLDVVFREDHSRIRSGRADENMAFLRKAVISAVKNEMSSKGSLKARRKIIGWDNDYLMKILTAN